MCLLLISDAKSITVYFDGEKSTFAANTAGGKLLYSVKSRKTVRKLAAEELFEYAVKSLGMRASTSAELKTKLMRRAAHPPDVEAALTRLSSFFLFFL
jgi:hypothetical protein